jgi:hypothetical protein
MDIIVILFVFIFGFVFGWLRASKSILDKILGDPDSMMNLLKKYKDAKDDEVGDNVSVRELRVEKHGEQLYLFDKDSNEFLAQGSTLQEAIANVEKRFPDQTFCGLMSKEEADTLGIKA